MSIFKRRKNKEEYEIDSKDVPVSTLVRWFLYDTELMDPNSGAVALGLNPVSEEGAVVEEEDSDNRLAQIIDLMPFIEIMGAITANSVLAAQEEDLPEDLSDKFPVDLMLPLYELIAKSALVSGLASAVQLGLVSKNTVRTMDVTDKENYDD